MPPRRRLMAFPLAVSLTLLAGSPLAAQTPAAMAGSPEASASAPREQAEQKASAHFRRGVVFFQGGDFRSALVEFAQAHASAPDYRLLYNIGQTQQQLNDFAGAAQSYEHYLSQGGPEISPARRADVETQLVALRERVARIAITANEPGAEVRVDDVSVGITPLSQSVSVNAGRHRVEVTSRKGATRTEVIEVAPGELRQVTLELTFASNAATSGEAASPRLSPMRRRAVGAWAGAGAAAIGAVVSGVLAAHKMAHLDRAKQDVGVSSSRVADLAASARAHSITSSVLGGLTIAAGVTGAVLWFMKGHGGTPRTEEEEHGHEAAHWLWGFGPGMITVGGCFP